MKKFSGEYWIVNLPDAWLGESEAGFDVIYDPEGVGELQISGSCHDQLIEYDDLYELAAEHIEAGAEEEQVEFGEFSGITLEYEVDDELIREWYLKSGSIMLFITYSCLLEDEGKEDDVVESVLESLRLLSN